MRVHGVINIQLMHYVYKKKSLQPFRICVVAWINEPLLLPTRVIKTKLHIHSSHKLQGSACAFTSQTKDTANHKSSILKMRKRKNEPLFFLKTAIKQKPWQFVASYGMAYTLQQLHGIWTQISTESSRDFLWIHAIQHIPKLYFGFFRKHSNTLIWCSTNFSYY